MATTYSPSNVREYLAALAALEAVPQERAATGEYESERNRLTEAEEALLAEGWKNEETIEQLRNLVSA